MLKRNLILIALALLVLAAGLLPAESQAVPAFARTHKISCSTCHAPFPRLKPFGEEFAGNGFTIPEEEKARDFISAGDDLLKLNKDFPLAVRFDAYATLESDTDVTSDMKTPWGLKLMSGGNLSKKVGYYFYFYMDERGEVAGVEDAYIHFNNIGDRPFDIMVGQFQTSDPLMKRELRLTYEDYNIYKATIGNSNTNLTYDRGVLMTYDFESTGTGLIGLVVNGNGKPEADENRHFDADKYKNYAFKVTQDVGDFLGLGFYYYYGKEVGFDVADLAGAMPQTNEVTYWGPDFTLGNGTFDLTCQYLVRKDSDPLFTGTDVDGETTGIVAELVISPQKDRSRHYLTLLYNQIDSDWDSYDDETFTISGTHLLARNLRGVVEYTRNLDQETSRGVVGFTSAF
jgi:hypothetical protein